MTVAACSSAGDRRSVIARATALIQRNELAEAAPLLRRILAETPDDAAVLYLLATVRRLERQTAEAEQLYRRSLALDGRQAHAHRDLGRLLSALGWVEEGLAELREAMRLKPDDADTHFGLASAFARRGDHVSAENSFRNGLRWQPGHVMGRLGLAEVLCHLDRPKDAERILREALSSGAHESRVGAALAHGLGIALKQQGRFSEALRLFDAAQARQPDFAAVDYTRGETLQQLGRWEEAAHSFRKFLARHPAHANAQACLALISAIKGDFANARECSTNALARDPNHSIAHIALATTEIEACDYTGAAARLHDLLENPARTKDQGSAIASGFAAEAFDRHGRYYEAFAVSRASKANLRDLWSGQFGSRRMVDIANGIIGCLEKMPRWSTGAKPPPGAEEPACHVFLLGFLRSGTTLLETVMATDENVVHADEVDFLRGAAETFVTRTSGLERLAALDENEVEALRNAYWKSVRDAKFSVGGKVFVDKMPINTFRLPLISRLFPSAKVIFAIRDPRDVVLSCFRRHFGPTPYSYELLRLEDCARFYASAMRFADLCRQKLPLDLLEHRYEDMVADFANSVRAVCRFTGIAWSEAMREFQGAAGGIDLTSASARQVRRGLYGDAVGHWRHYSNELAPALPILAPWVARFGYPAG